MSLYEYEPAPGGALASLLRQAGFSLHDEKACQAEIEAHLVDALGREAVSREHRLSQADVPDFLVRGRWVVEVKIGGAPKRDLERQLERYAAHDAVEAIVLVTATAVSLPAEMGGKPVHAVNLGEGWL